MIEATRQADWYTKSQLAGALNQTPAAISNAIKRGNIPEPVRVRFPAGNILEGYHASWVQALLDQCHKTYRLPKTLSEDMPTPAGELPYE